MRRVVGICVAAVAAFGGSSAGAAVLFSDNFDTEPVGAAGWVMNDSSFANFAVTQGAVDLLGADNPFSLTGVGNFVDLDGTTGRGGTLQTLSTFNYKAGDTVTLDVLVSGNQRRGTDGLFAGFVFTDPQSIADITTSGFTGTTTVGQRLLGTVSLGSDAAYQHYTISFSALTAGSLGALVGTDSNDAIGPLLDGLDISAMGVPEPAGWSLMILGFGGMGAVLRRRRTAVRI